MLGGGNYLDNGHAGGMFIAIDNDGTLHKTAFTEFKDEYEVHPDTGLKFDGYRIELYEKVLDTAIRMHEAIPQVGVVNWDFTIDENGEPLLIEANINDGKRAGSIWLSEMPHGRGPFGDNTKEVLRWLRMMKKLSKKERYKYQFGYFKEKEYV